MKKQLLIVGIIVLLVCVGLSGCTGSDDEETSSNSWHKIGTWSGSIFNGSLSGSISLPYGLDSKTFLITNITADNEYHCFSEWIILNTGSVWSDFTLDFEGKLSLIKTNETGHIIHNLSIGEMQEINDISIIISINENSSNAKNKIIISEDNIGEFFTLIESLAPGNETNLYFYMKSYNETISGKYEALFQIHITQSASTFTPIYNPDFQLLDMDENEFRFKLDFYLILSSDTTIGDIVISYPDDKTLKPNLFSPIYNNTSEYEISIPINFKRNNTQYPFDTDNKTIKIEAFNDAKTKYIARSLEHFDKKEIKTEKWIFTISADDNLIYIKLERNQERTVFYVLFIIGLILLALRIIYIFGIKKYSQKRKLENFIFYVGSSISIPFYFGVLFNWILYISPSVFISWNILLLGILSISIVLDACSHVIKEETNEKTIEELWKRRKRRNYSNLPNLWRRKFRR